MGGRDLSEQSGKSIPALSSHSPPAKVLVFGNEKGGTGKSTLAMHVVVSLMDAGLSVVVIDLDSRQRSLSRYIENRHGFSRMHELDLPTPKGFVMESSSQKNTDRRDVEDEKNLTALVVQLSKAADVVVIDCPGNHTRLAEVAHTLADTLLTPLNDSFVDLDLLGRVNQESFKVERFSHYSETVWESRKRRSAKGLPPTDWVVTRNRMSVSHARNKARMHMALKELQGRFAFRYVGGLSERVIYRELFPQGLTLLDFPRVPQMGSMALSHVAARQELRQLVNDLRLLPTSG
ncbi:MAG: division plane positioning ATPase MipZ [bacterium]